MHTVELLKQALDLARRSGYQIRQEWLDGSPGGACVIRGQKWLFLDPSRPRQELLGDVLDALWSDPGVTAIDVSSELLREFDDRPKTAAQRKAA